MNGSNTEYAFYFFPPQFAATGGDGVGKAGRGLQQIPWLNNIGSRLFFAAGTTAK